MARRIRILTVLTCSIIFSSALAALPSAALATTSSVSASQVQLRSARTLLDQSRHALAHAQKDLRESPFTPRSHVRGMLARGVLSAQLRVDRLVQVVQRLRTQVAQADSLDAWARQGRWRPVIDRVAGAHGISSAGLYRMMILESGGRRYADGGLYKGLFQYSPSTWQGSWNPYRSASIYDGLAQIKATALAVHRGYGPSMWPNTYPAAF